MPGPNVASPVGRRRFGACVAVLTTMAVLAGLGPSGVGSAGAAPAQQQDDRLAEVDRFVAEFAATNRIPGVALSVVHNGDRYVRGFGSGIGPDTRFALASESKTFTAIAVLQLVQEGRVDLQRPVRDYLPDLRSADPRFDDITVDMLLRMSSGLSEINSPAPPRTTPGDAMLAAAVDGLGELPLFAPPGETFNYANLNYTLLARIVELVSGTPYHDYLRTRIFEPLGMTGTTAVELTSQLDPAILPGLAPGHAQVLGLPFPWPETPLFVVGAGDVVSTATDMARWLEVVREGDAGGVLPPGVLEQARQPLDPARNSYAMGWMTYPATADLPLRIYGGGDLPTYHTDIVIVPETGTAVSVMVNTNLVFPPVRLPLLYREIATGASAILHGQDPGSVADPISAGDNPTVRTVADLVPLALVLLAVVGAVRGVVRAPAWVAARRRGPRWRLAGSLFGLGLLVIVPFALLGLFSLAAGRPVPVNYLFSAWPSAFVAAVSPAVAALVVAAARAAATRPATTRSDRR